MKSIFEGKNQQERTTILINAMKDYAARPRRYKITRIDLLNFAVGYIGDRTVYLNKVVDTANELAIEGIIDY